MKEEKVSERNRFSKREATGGSRKVCGRTGKIK